MNPPLIDLFMFFVNFAAAILGLLLTDWVGGLASDVLFALRAWLPFYYVPI